MTSLPTPAHEPLRKQVMTLRIIVLALAAGVIAFAIFAIVQNLGKPHTLAGKLDQLSVMLLGFGLITLVLGVVVPPIVFATSRGTAVQTMQTACNEPELARVLWVLLRMQNATIIGCALFEGGAFANVFGYMQSNELLHLILAGVLVLGILVRFPLQGLTEQRLELELRRLKEEEGLRVNRQSL
jgi:hypothetical protein